MVVSWLPNQRNLLQNATNVENACTNGLRKHGLFSVILSQEKLTSSFKAVFHLGILEDHLEVKGSVKQETLRNHSTKWTKSLLKTRLNIFLAELKNHMVYHVKVRRFPCTACESSFLEKRHLDRHLRRIHSGIKNFFCNACGKAFFEKFELNYHLRMSPCNLDEK